ncbi:MAG: RodZ domain-containing protein [Nitrospirota bacterium]
MIILFWTSVDIYATDRELDQFDRGYQYYLSYQPERAAESLRAFLEEFPDSSIKDAALFWLAKSLLQTESYEEARKTFLELKQQFAGSPYIPHVDRELQLMSELEKERAQKAENKPGISGHASELIHEREKLTALLEETLKRIEELREERAKLEAKEAEVKALLEKFEVEQRNWEEVNRDLALLKDEYKRLDSEVQKLRGKRMERAVTLPPVAKAETPTASGQGHIHTLEMTAREATWILAIIDDEETKEVLMNPSDYIKWSARTGFSLKIGNAAGVDLIFDGKAIGPLGQAGQVVRLKLPYSKDSR